MTPTLLESLLTCPTCGHAEPLTMPGDGVQYATGCTPGKGNMDKTPYGKLAVTVIERATNRTVRVPGDKHVCIPCSGYER